MSSSIKMTCMKFNHSLENRLVEIDQQAKELEIQNDQLNEQVDTMLAEYNVSPSQLTAFISSPENFTPANWENLQEEKKKREEALERELSQIVSLEKKKKSRKALSHLPNYALFVR